MMSTFISNEIWGVNIFNNIARAEQTHVDSVKVILDITYPIMIDVQKYICYTLF